jgi:hypothetical protein
VRGQVNLPASDDHPEGLAIDYVALVAAQRRAEPGQELAHRERLGHVVVGAGIERADLVAGAGPAGQHDDRRPVPAAQLDDDLGATDVGQAEVEDDRVRQSAGGQCQRLPPCACSHHVIQPGPEVDPQGSLQLRLVLDDQDPAHAGVLRTGRAVTMIPERPAFALPLLKPGRRIPHQQRRIARPWRGNHPRRKKIGHGPIIAQAAVTAR